MRVVLSAQRAIKLRESFGLSVPEMAHKLSISVSNIYRVELKGTSRPTGQQHDPSKQARTINTVNCIKDRAHGKTHYGLA